MIRIVGDRDREEMSFEDFALSKRHTYHRRGSFEPKPQIDDNVLDHDADSTGPRVTIIILSSSLPATLTKLKSQSSPYPPRDARAHGTIYLPSGPNCLR